ncbi:hypothetical protein [Roseateles sp.]|uniref:hypothetical protein n=1 Tax=Roseateles sp. TaxID=1971397 RepID=UPI003266DFD9
MPSVSVIKPGFNAERGIVATPRSARDRRALVFDVSLMERSHVMVSPRWSSASFRR